MKPRLTSTRVIFDRQLIDWCTHLESLSLGGLILNKAVNKFSGIAVFQPVFNGVGGNLVAVQASRISTYLHTNVRKDFGHFYVIYLYLAQALAHIQYVRQRAVIV